MPAAQSKKKPPRQEEKQQFWFPHATEGYVLGDILHHDEDLNTLQAWATSKFSAVPRRPGVGRPDREMAQRTSRRTRSGGRPWAG